MHSLIYLIYFFKTFNKSLGCIIKASYYVILNLANDYCGNDFKTEVMLYGHETTIVIPWWLHGSEHPLYS